MKVLDVRVLHTDMSALPHADPSTSRATRLCFECPILKLRDHVTSELPILVTLQTYCPEVNRKVESTLEKLKFMTVFRHRLPL